ncbi:MAG: hypothetical protein JWM27_104 [Gemmatimonadetes bacterium]|nr:hypothetical protein [Gemmatimonadota bacterium]
MGTDQRARALHPAEMLEGFAARLRQEIQRGQGTENINLTDFATAVAAHTAGRWTGTNRTVIKRVLDGEQRPSVELVVSAAQALGVKAEWLLTGRGPRTDEDAGYSAAAQAEIAALRSLIPVEPETLRHPFDLFARSRDEVLRDALVSANAGHAAWRSAAQALFEPLIFSLRRAEMAGTVTRAEADAIAAHVGRSFVDFIVAPSALFGVAVGAMDTHAMMVYAHAAVAALGSAGVGSIVWSEAAVRRVLAEVRKSGGEAEGGT